MLPPVLKSCTSHRTDKVSVTIWLVGMFRLYANVDVMYFLSIPVRTWRVKGEGGYPIMFECAFFDFLR